MSWDSKLTGDERRERAGALATANTEQTRAMLLDYMALGWHVFPTLHQSKRPLVHWPTEATTSPALISDWLTKWPGCGWAVNVGMSQLWVVDCDSDEGKWEWIEHCAAHNALNHLTAIAESGGGGIHYYYRDPFAQGVQSVRRFGEHFDTRAAGGYVVVPPTLHASGRRYRWLPGSEPTQHLARIPQWVTEEWHPMGRRPPFHGLWTCGRGEGLVERLLRSSGDERTKCLKRAAMHVGRLDGRGELAQSVLGDLANAAITRGVPHEEAYRIAEAAYKATKELG